MGRDNIFVLSGKNLMFISTVIMILRTFIPFVAKALPGLIRYSLILIQLVCLILAMHQNTKIKSKFYSSLPFIFLLTFLYCWRREATYGISYAKSIVGMIYFVIPIWTGIYYMIVDDKKSVNLIFNLTFICVLITCITTLIGLNLYPEASRLMSQGAESYSVYYKMNIASFGFSYALIIFVFMILYNLDKIKISKIFILFIILYTIIKMEFSIAIIFTFISIICAFIRSRKDRVITTFFGVVGLVYIIFSNSLDKILEFFQKFLEEYNLNMVAWKIFNIRNILNHNNVATKSVDGRIGAYQKSFDGFLEHPIFGNAFSGKMNSTIGKHSELLDFMSGFGILGAISLLSVYYYYFSVCRKQDKHFSFKKSWMVKYLIVMLILLSIFNQIILAPEISFAIFLLPILYIKRNKNTVKY